MSRHLVLSGGPAHPFADTSAMLGALLAGQGIETEVVTEPEHAIAALRAAAEGVADPIALVTVNALRWSMAQDRYAEQRPRYGVALDPADLAVLDGFVRRGGGLLALHTAVICFDADPTWHELCGASWSWERSSHPPLGPVRVEVTEAGRVHELTAGVGSFVVEDEAYGFLDEVQDLEPLLVSEHGGRTHPVLWARQLGAGRVVTDLLGHGPASLEHPAHRAVLTRVAAWATRGGATATTATRRQA